MSLVARFARQLDALRLPPGPLLVAVSGGVDSIVLLDLLRRTRERHGHDLVVAHADHGLVPESAQVADRVRRLVSLWGLACEVTRLDLPSGASETNCRAARYRWLHQVRRKVGARCLVLAHHADDQAETILMRLLRGSGPAGLAGMSARRGALVRPLLPFPRDTLLRYARARRLDWWEDPANADSRHLRSWLRGEIIPRLESRLPEVRRRVRVAGRHAAADRTAWREALRTWPGLDWKRGRRVSSVHWPTLSALPDHLAQALVLAWVRQEACPAGPTRVAHGLAALRDAQSGATADLGYGWRYELSFDTLRLVSPASAGHREAAVPIADPSGELNWGDWLVRWRMDTVPSSQPRDGATAWFIPGPLTVRGLRAGDRLVPLGGVGHRLAVRCLQDARIPSSERPSWPMIERAGTLTWIPGVCRSALELPPAGAMALRVDVEPRG